MAAAAAAAAAGPPGLSSAGGAGLADGPASPRSDSSHYSSASEGGLSSANGGVSNCKQGAARSSRNGGGGGGGGAGLQTAASTPQAVDGIEQPTPEGAFAADAAAAADVPLANGRAGASRPNALAGAASQADAHPASALADVPSNPDAMPAGTDARMPGGECLLHYPDRPINVPFLQVRSLSMTPCKQRYQAHLLPMVWWRFAFRHRLPVEHRHANSLSQQLLNRDTSSILLCRRGRR